MRLMEITRLRPEIATSMDKSTSVLKPTRRSQVLGKTLGNRCQTGIALAEGANTYGVWGG